MATPARTAPEPIRIDRPAVEELATSLRGDLIGPDDPAYDGHRRVWNGSIDRHPALIARCTGVEDVRAAVGFARTHGLLVAVRGGGHSFPGYSVCDAGMVIDLSPMKRIRVDAATRTARVGAGVLLGELDRETQAHGLAVPAGIVTHTGIAGLTLGGGIGWIMRKHGLTIDNLLSVEMVTADGASVGGERHQQRRPVLGGSRWRRQLRDRDRVRVPAAPAGTRCLRRSGLLADGAGPRGTALLPRLDRRLPR
jgi:FAD/FMN-containing dehydrogenase